MNQELEIELRSEYGQKIDKNLTMESADNDSQEKIFITD
jgi:hypothetical protein